MRSYDYVTVDVFTEQRFGGNPLAVVPDAAGLDDVEMQSLAAEFNYSETTFVLPPDDPAHTARVRIFNRTYEMPFAGHPNVGTAFALASADPGLGDTLVFEGVSGLVRVQVERDDAGVARGATIEAPQPLSTTIDIPLAAIAACLGIDPVLVDTRIHPPLSASVGVPFLFAAVEPGALLEATPRLDAFRALDEATPELAGRVSLLAYAREGDAVRARMFAPLAGTWEDPATGSAAAALVALLLSLDGGDALELTVTQGVEMGRPSRIDARAWRGGDGVRAAVGGTCVPVFRGSVEL